MNIIDLHCDTLLAAYRDRSNSFVDGNYSINLNLLKENKAFAQFFAIYLSREEMKTMDSYVLLNKVYDFYRELLEEHGDVIAHANSYKDIVDNRERGLVSSILTIEDGVFLDGKLERLQEVYDKGVRLITLLWNFENSVGYPNKDSEEEHARGLKPFGIDVVEEMNRLGMIIDVSHLSEGGFYDVAKYSKKPFTASHSCARALCNHRRNLTDDQLKTLGDLGGVVGVNFEKSFLEIGNKKATVEQVVRHLVYMRNKAGIDAIAFGSDFDGIADAGEIVNYSGLNIILEALEKEFTSTEIDKISYGNVKRLIEDVMGE